ncbi:unnamed protein product [Miscanthus lutarioriparius]|uniref:Uncharacterized protein n=1 Tax=Miscanthus lutarioriparius TaxID=422564 RepID=A0A811PYK5_9POAL|nr:unnamed protein product [Miscanthus lutarioriparius]
MFLWCFSRLRFSLDASAGSGSWRDGAWAPAWWLSYSCCLLVLMEEVYMTDLTALFTWTCSRCNDLTQGFEMRSLIVDVENCLQAFVGVAHNLNSIIVAIRGTQENSCDLCLDLINQCTELDERLDMEAT